MSAVAIIPARGGSQRIPRKNIRDFMGKPIIAYSIETAKASGLFDRIIVTTDDEEISRIALQYGAEYMPRSEEMARDEVGTQEVMRWALEGDDNPEYACCIYATAPLMQSNDLVNGFHIMQTGASYSMSVGSEPLRDAGQWYWGRAGCFLTNMPLISNTTRMVPIPENRVCDINVESDWLRCERMYAELYGLV